MTGLPPEVFERGGDDLSPQASVGTTLASPAPWFVEWLTGRVPGEMAGPTVNERTAETYAAFFSCVSLIADTLASLPLKVYTRRPDGGQDEAPDRPEYDLLQSEFNPNTSAMTGRQAGNAHLLTWGNSYCQIVRNRLDRSVLALMPLGPDIVEVDNTSGPLTYTVYDRMTGQVLATLPREEVLHVPGYSFDALCGLSMVRLAKSTIRAGMAMEREAEKYVTRGIRPPGGIKFPQGKKFANETAARKYQETFRRVHANEDSTLNIVVIEDGAEWFDIGTDPATAQLLESRKWTALQLCGIYRVPPHMVGLIEKTTAWGTGVEELTIGFVVYCLLPVIRRIEQEYNRKLFRADKAFFCEHVLSGLLRGDSQKQANAIKLYLEMGIISVNEARKLLGFNPTVGGNVRYYPLNMGRVDSETGEDILPPEPATPAKPSPATLAEPKLIALESSLRQGMASIVSRYLKREANAARGAAKKPETFLASVEAFYETHAEHVADGVRPILEAWQAAFGGGVNEYAPAHVEQSKAELVDAAVKTASSPRDFAHAVEAVTARWLDSRPALAAASLTRPEVPAHV